MNYSRTTTQIHLHGEVTTSGKHFTAAHSCTGQVYGILKVAAGQSDLHLFIESSAQAQAITAALAELTNDLAIAEVERDNALAALEDELTKADEAVRQQSDSMRQPSPAPLQVGEFEVGAAVIFAELSATVDDIFIDGPFPRARIRYAATGTSEVVALDSLKLAAQ